MGLKRNHGLFSRSNCLHPSTKEKSLAKSSRTEDEKPVPIFSSGTNGIEKKPPLVLRIKLPPAHNKEKSLAKRRMTRLRNWYPRALQNRLQGC
ncbi:hypothetical protein SLA2020_276320 [Shorea laevis]